MSSTTDRIEKTILLHAPRERVWRAISDAGQFGTWFGARFDGPFSAGRRVTGAIAPTTVDPEIARRQKPHEGERLEVTVDRIEPMRRFSFHWHPGADPLQEASTTVEFDLKDAAGGTQLTITESGFDQLPPERRSQVRAGNDEGWSAQARLIERYLATMLKA